MTSATEVKAKMAEATPINIQIDPEALKTQIQEVVHKEFGEMATRLRMAADALDQGKFWEWRSEEDNRLREQAYQKGFEAGKAARDE